MGAFEYRALDAAGRSRRGVEEADSARQVRARLRERGLTPLEVTAVGGSGGSLRERLLRNGGRDRVSAGDLVLLTRQLATLIQAGLPVDEALGAAAAQSGRRRVRAVLTDVRSRVTAGQGLAEALAAFPGVFPEIHRTTVATGERTGRLDVVLPRLADYTEARQALLQKVQLALLYPVLLCVLATAITLALLAYVVPEVVRVFADLDHPLPAVTRGLIALSDALRTHGAVAALVLAGAALSVHRLLRRPALRHRVHGWVLRTSLVGALVRGINAARFTRTLAILTASGVPVLDGVRLSAGVVTNAAIRRAVEEAADEVRDGASLSGALRRRAVFPPVTLQLIASGEASGELEAMLERAAASQERELQSATGVFVGLFEPALILVMGVIVLTVVLAILLPVFEMNQLLD